MSKDKENWRDKWRSLYQDVWPEIDEGIWGKLPLLPFNIQLGIADMTNHPNDSASWLACQNPRLLMGALTDLLREKKISYLAVRRKLLLLHVAVVRTTFHTEIINHQISRDILHLAETFIDDEVRFDDSSIQSRGRFHSAVNALLRHPRMAHNNHFHFLTNLYPSSVYGTEQPIFVCTNYFLSHLSIDPSFFHEVFGDPFNTPPFWWGGGYLYPGPSTTYLSLRDLQVRAMMYPDHVIRPVSWLTPDIVALARSIYDFNQWQDCPILADMLEDASCPDQHLLDHLRRSSPFLHSRGCWAIDFLLNKNTPQP